MADVHNPETRSRNMAAIGSKDTRIEIIVRDGFMERGLQFKSHVKELPGKPDFVFEKYASVIFVHSCFFHHHDCHFFKWPKTRKKFWRDKITGNQVRDVRNKKLLKSHGWNVLEIWECALRGKTRVPFDELMDRSVYWLEHEFRNKTIKGR